MGVSQARSLRAINMAEQPVFGAKGGEERLPLGVVGALDTEGDRHVLLDVDGGVGSVERCSGEDVLGGVRPHDTRGGRVAGGTRHGGGAKTARRAPSGSEQGRRGFWAAARLWSSWGARD
jgi:hypothetical protein